MGSGELGVLPDRERMGLERIRWIATFQPPYMEYINGARVTVLMKHDETFGTCLMPIPIVQPLYYPCMVASHICHVALPGKMGVHLSLAMQPAISLNIAPRRSELNGSLVGELDHVPFVGLEY